MPTRLVRDWTDSDKVNSLKSDAERFFTRLIMKADDYGLYTADSRLLRANLFPLLLNEVREADLDRWIAACVKASLVRLYEVESKRYLEIKNFKQRLDKANAKHPLPPVNNPKPVVNDFQETVNNFPTEVEVELEVDKQPILPVDTGEQELKKKEFESPEKEYEALKKTGKTITEFIENNKPKFSKPYMDIWNFFANKYKLSKISKITDTREKKLTVRLREETFDIIHILKKATESEYLLTGNWFSFDWILENESNYLKVLEGNYVQKVGEKKTPIPPIPTGPTYTVKTHNTP